jgi:serine protease Do
MPAPAPVVIHPHPSVGFERLLLAVLVGGATLIGWTELEARRVNREIAGLRETIRLAHDDQRRFEENIEQERRVAEADRRRLEAQIEEFRQREGALTRQLAEATAGEVQTLRANLRDTHERLKTIETERATAEQVIHRYGAGVCLLQGSYALYNASNRPLRYRVDERGEIVRREDGSPVLDVDGAGSIYTSEFFGTGFLIDSRGLILTNRHLVEPWGGDDDVQEHAKDGFSPRFVFFRAFFPHIAAPFEVKVAQQSNQADLAIVRATMKGQKVPVLPLDRSGRGAVPGQPVVLVGYPRGLDAIMAKADTGVVEEILAIHRHNSQRLTEVLSRRGLIRPSTTQGHIGDVTKTDVVFDALTTQGSSGGPLFNKNGEVIAVEYAVLEKFGGNSFAIPIHYALEMLKEPKKRVAG